MSPSAKPVDRGWKLVGPSSYLVETGFAAGRGVTPAAVPAYRQERRHSLHIWGLSGWQASPTWLRAMLQSRSYSRSIVLGAGRAQQVSSFEERLGSYSIAGAADTVARMFESRGEKMIDRERAAQGMKLWRQRRRRRRRHTTTAGFFVAGVAVL